MSSRRYITLNAGADATDQVVFESTGDVGSEPRAVAVTVHPGAGGTASLAVSCRAPADIGAGNADWVDVQFGANIDLSGEEGSELPLAINAVRLTATDAAATAHLTII